MRWEVRRIRKCMWRGARNISPDKHVCFRNWNNWNKSSSEMETDIIVEGFLEAEQVHGVRYIHFIGDGDSSSSVHPTLIQNVPGWGHAIKKLECACKCYRGALERLVQDNPSYKGNGGLTLKTRKRLISAARAAIRMRSTESDPKKALISLKRDLQNGPRHCFGFHDDCSPDFCKTAQDKLSSTSSHPQQYLPRSHISTGENSEDNDDVLDGEFRPTE